MYFEITGPCSIASDPAMEGHNRLAGGRFCLAMMEDALNKICAKNLLTSKSRTLMHRNDMPAGSGDWRLMRRRIMTLGSTKGNKRIIEQRHLGKLSINRVEASKRVVKHKQSLNRTGNLARRAWWPLDHYNRNGSRATQQKNCRGTELWYNGDFINCDCRRF